MTALALLLAVLALLNGTAAIFMALLPPFPVSWLYVHARWRKAVAWTLLAAVSAVFAASGTSMGQLLAVLLTALGVVLTHRMHQETAFPAIDFPPMAAEPLGLPLKDDAQLAVVEVDGVARAYPLDFVVHHHVVNDRLGSRLVSLTYCAMCRSILPFDVTDLGPLYVGSFKDANMIVADRRTGTFFQQATCESLLGPLHPRTLTLVPFQLFSWAEVRTMLPAVQVAAVTPHDLRPFELPIPRLWRRIIASEATPGLPAARRDRTFPARTHVVGIVDAAVRPGGVFLKEEVLRRGVVHDPERDLVLVATGDAVNGFRRHLDGAALDLSLTEARTLRDRVTGTTWDLRGHHLSGPLARSLTPVGLSDEYWFSWRRFHPDAPLIRV